MTPDSILLIAIIVATVVAFALDRWPIDLVAFASLGLLLVTNLVTAEQALAGFSNPAVITVMMMFILSEGLVRSGLVERVGRRITRLSPTHAMPSVLLLLVLTGILSAFINNVAAVSILMPVSLQLAQHYRFSPSKILLPLSYVSIFGGACTLIGTSTNLLVASLAEEAGQPPIGVFEFLPLGLILLLVGLVYTMLVPARYLPSRAILSSLTRKYQMSAFLTEYQVPPSSPLVGRTVLSEGVHARFDVNVLEILRGEKKISIDLRNTAVAPGDQLIARGGMNELIAFRDHFRLIGLAEAKLGDQDLSDDNHVLVEVQLAPMSQLTGMTIKEMDFRKRFGCFVLALNRTGETIRQKVTSIPLKVWDILLVFGPRARVEALAENDNFTVLQELDVKLRLSRRWWVAPLIVTGVVALAATGLMPIVKSAMLGVIVLLLSGLMPIQRAYKAVNWTVIFLVACLIPLGTAMKTTGLDALISSALIDTAGALGPLALLALIYFVTSTLTEFVSNNSTVIMMVPVALTIAASLSLDPRPFVMAVAFAGSSSFLTPMGYKTNAMVFGPGAYRFADYVKVGLPLKFGFWILSVMLIPLIWPIQPL